jgi:hypothetical protein
MRPPTTFVALTVLVGVTAAAAFAWNRGHTSSGGWTAGGPDTLRDERGADELSRAKDGSMGFPGTPGGPI